MRFSTRSGRLGWSADELEGDVKLYGEGRDQQDPSVRQAYRATIRSRIDWEPEEPFHLFAIEVRSAGFMIFGEQAYGLAWDPAKGTRRWNQRLE